MLFVCSTKSRKLEDLNPVVNLDSDGPLIGVQGVSGVSWIKVRFIFIVPSRSPFFM